MNYIIILLFIWILLGIFAVELSEGTFLRKYPEYAPNIITVMNFMLILSGIIGIFTIIALIKINELEFCLYHTELKKLKKYQFLKKLEQ